MTMFNVSYRKDSQSYHELFHAIDVMDAISQCHFVVEDAHILSVTVAEVEVPLMKDSELVEVLFYKDPSLGFGVSSNVLDKNEWQWLTGEDVTLDPEDYVVAVARRLRDYVVPGLSVVAVYDDNGEFEDSFIVTLFSESSDIGVSRKMSVKDIALDSDDVIIAVPIARAILSVLAPFGGG